jgi:hypothetical protein
MSFSLPHQLAPLIGALVSSFDWSYEDHGSSTFVPIGNIDATEWVSVDGQITKDDVEALSNTKRDAFESIGFTLTWKDSNIGGQFIQYWERPRDVLMLPTVNPVKLPATQCIDVSWYLARMVPGLVDLDLQSLSVEMIAE